MKKLLTLLLLSISTGTFCNQNLSLSQPKETITLNSDQQDKLNCLNDQSPTKHQVNIKYDQSNPSYSHVITKISYNITINPFFWLKVSLDSESKGWEKFSRNPKNITNSFSASFFNKPKTISLIDFNPNYQEKDEGRGPCSYDKIFNPHLKLDLDFLPTQNQLSFSENYDGDYHQDKGHNAYPEYDVEDDYYFGMTPIINSLDIYYAPSTYQVATDPQINLINNMTVDGIKYDEIAKGLITFTIPNYTDSGIYQIFINNHQIDIPETGNLQIAFDTNSQYGLKLNNGVSFQITLFTQNQTDQKQLNYLITDNFNSQLESFTTDESQTKITTYQGYLNGDANKQVNVVSALNFQAGASTKITLHNQDQLLALANPQDMSGSWMQLLDANYQPSKKPNSWLGIDNMEKIDLPNKTADMQVYQLVLKDQLNNELDYYVQLGGTANNIPDTPKTNPATPKSYTYPLIILVATILVAIIIASLIIRFVVNKSKYGASKK